MSLLAFKYKEEDSLSFLGRSFIYFWLWMARPSHALSAAWLSKQRRTHNRAYYSHKQSEYEHLLPQNKLFLVTSI